MKVVSILPFFIASTLAVNSKSVNFALQTSFVFDPKTANKDVSIISNLRKFLSKLESYILPKQILRTNDEPKNRLTNFLKNFAEVLIHYNEDEINEFTKALDGEMEDYYYTGTVFHQIVFDPKLKMFLRNSIKEWTVTDPNELKNHLKSYLNSTDNVFTNFISFLDKFYTSKDEEELNTIISHITKPKPIEELSEIIKQALKFIVFERYEKLNYTSKAKLAKKIGKLTQYVAINYPSKVKGAETVFNFKRHLENDTFPEDGNNTDVTDSLDNQKTRVVKELFLNKNFDIDVRRADNLDVPEELKLKNVAEETTSGAATIIFRSDDNPGVTNVINLADLLWEHGSTDPDIETLNFKLKI